MRYAVTRVHSGGRVSRSVQRQGSLDRTVPGGLVERIKHDLRRALSVGLGVHRNFRWEKRGFFKRNPEFVVGRVMPAFLHVIPIRDDTALDQEVRQAQRSDAQHLYPDLSWRHRSYRGGRLRSTPKSPRHAWGKRTLEQRP